MIFKDNTLLCIHLIFIKIYLLFFIYGSKYKILDSECPYLCNIGDNTILLVMASKVPLHGSEKGIHEVTQDCLGLGFHVHECQAQPKKEELQKHK